MQLLHMHTAAQKQQLQEEMVRIMAAQTATLNNCSANHQGATSRTKAKPGPRERQRMREMRQQLVGDTNSGSEGVSLNGSRESRGEQSWCLEDVDDENCNKEAPCGFVGNASACSNNRAHAPVAGVVRPDELVNDGRESDESDTTYTSIEVPGVQEQDDSNGHAGERQRFCRGGNTDDEAPFVKMPDAVTVSDYDHRTQQLIVDEPVASSKTNP